MSCGLFGQLPDQSPHFRNLRTYVSTYLNEQTHTHKVTICRTCERASCASATALRRGCKSGNISDTAVAHRCLRTARDASETASFQRGSERIERETEAESAELLRASALRVLLDATRATAASGARKKGTDAAAAMSEGKVMVGWQGSEIGNVATKSDAREKIPEVDTTSFSSASPCCSKIDVAY